MKKIKGNRTYLLAAAMVVLAGLKAQGYINDGTFEWAQGLLLGGGLATLRAGIKK